MKFIRKFLIGAVVVLGLCLSGGASAGEAVDFVKPRLDVLIHTPPGSHMSRRVGGDFFDYDTMAERALGPARQGMSDELWVRYRRAMEGVILLSLWSTVYRLREYDVTYTREVIKPRSGVVTLWAEGPNSRTFVEFVLKKDESDRWRVIDMHFEMISLIGMWRGSFKKVIEQEGYVSLVQRLENDARKVEPDRSGAGR